jgi:hypothetical protein
VKQNAESSFLAEEVTALEAADHAVTPMKQEQPPRPAERRWLLVRSNAAVVATALGVLAVILLLPLAASSLINQLQETDIAPAYDVLTGKPLDPDRQNIAPLDATYANFSISAIDAATRAATIAVSGNRLCHADCPDVSVTVYSLAAPGSLTRGLPPSASFTVPGQTGPIATTLELPVAGDPQRYPFDAYTLILGISSQDKSADGTMVPVSKDQLAATAEMTVSSAVSWLQMAAPELIDSAQMTTPAGGAPYLSVLRLDFTRPAYVQVLTILLVLLIIASGAVLTIVILLMLLGLAIRATLSFWRQAQAARH